MGLFSSLSNAKTQGRGIKIKEDAEFVTRIDRIKLQPSNQGFGTLFIVEFTIVEGTEDNPTGADRSWVQMPEHGQRKNTDPGNIKAFMAAVIGDTSDDPAVPEEVFKNATQPDNPYAGTILKLATKQVVTKNGYDFVIHDWNPVAEGYTPAAMPLAVAGEEPKRTRTHTAPPMPPAAPPAPQELTKEAWVAGAGSGTLHPDNPSWEWNTDNPDWGLRQRKGI